jgi:ferredoxin-NADP reductase
MTVIDPAAPQYNATLVRRVDQHDSLAHFWVRFDANPRPFKPGQYMTIGVIADGRMVQRPFSVASDPAVAGSDGYEMYVRLVAGGEFTPLLWRLSVGDRMRMIGPKGRFTLEPNDDRIHLLISSGTGNAPFVAMTRALLRQGRPRRTVLLNGVSYAADLGYRDLFEGWQSSGEYPLTYIPTVSRPADATNAGWRGRTGRVESIVAPVCDELGLTPANSVAFICGNPEMIISAEGILKSRGFSDDQIEQELYWPKGKTPDRVAP